MLSFAALLLTLQLVTASTLSRPEESGKIVARDSITNKRTFCLFGSGCSSNQFCSLGLCQSCDGGFFLFGGSSCSKCPPGSYSPIGSLSQLFAPLGSFCPGEGNTNPTPAPAGHYCPSTGLSAPVPAPIGSFCSGTGSTSYTPAPAGHYCGSTGSTAPTPAPAGSYCSGTGSKAPIPAPEGFYCSGTGNTSPTKCPAGSSCSGTGNTGPNLAPLGHYIPSIGSLLPIKCAAGSYSDILGAISCKTCPLGFLCPEGCSSPTPVTCSAGSAPVGSECKQCLPGFYSDGKQACTPCALGSFSLAGVAKCTLCPINTFASSIGTANFCAPCSSGCDAGSSTCVPPVTCKAGSYKTGTTCTPCAAGTFSSLENSLICAICPINQISASGAASCTPCASNQVANLAHTSCTAVSTATWHRRSERSQVCEAGLTACAINAGPRSRAFECVDTQNDIQSCGGCWSDGTGVDCTAFDDRATPSCVQGKCQYTCPTGWNLTALGCVKK